MQPEPFGVVLLNVSEGGFCIYSPQPGQVGQRVSLKLGMEEGVGVLGNVRWCAALDDGFLIGCAFLDHASYISVRTALDMRVGFAP